MLGISGGGGREERRGGSGEWARGERGEGGKGEWEADKSNHRGSKVSPCIVLSLNYEQISSLSFSKIHTYICTHTHRQALQTHKKVYANL